MKDGNDVDEVDESERGAIDVDVNDVGANENGMNEVEMNDVEKPLWRRFGICREIR